VLGHKASKTQRQKPGNQLVHEFNLFARRDEMKAKFNCKLRALGVIMVTMLLLPALSQAKEEKGHSFEKFRAKVMKQLKLTPDQEKSFKTADEKYATERKQIIADLKKSQNDLQAAVKAAKPDEAKIKGLVSAITADQDKLFDSFKNQRNAELALLNPVQQGEYLVALRHWRHEMEEKYKHKKEKK
jgi:Spy/CpxP family protein refolding chaperone